MSQPSAACCTVPPVVSTGYKIKGEYVDVDGIKTYVTGSPNATYGIFDIFDIFGFKDQTLQGADILAHSNTEKFFQVFMPDILEGEWADMSWYPPDNEEKGKKLGEFFKGPAEPGKNVERVSKIIASLKKKYPNIQKWGLIGYCWGGKVAVLSSGKGTPFSAAGEIHPAMVDPSDGPNVAIPLAILPSGDEDKEAVEKFAAALKVDHTLEFFPEMVHGWMAARSDLSDDKVKAEYERGYKVLIDFFHKQL